MKAKVMNEGAPALDNFVQAMKELFRVPKKSIQATKQKKKKPKKQPAHRSR